MSDTKTAAIQRIDKLKVAFNEDFVQNQLQQSLAESAPSFIASVIDLYTGEKSLQECDPKRVIMEAMKAAVLKLPLVKSLGYAWLVAYKGVPQFQIGYKGLVQLAIRTNMYKHINCGPVYDGELRLINKLSGEIDISGMAKSDKVIGYFAYFELKNGFSKMLYSTTEKVTMHAQKYSKFYRSENSPWKTEFDAMATKTVLTTLLKKWGYLSVEMLNAVTDDEATQDPAADAIINEIRENGNKVDLGFTDAEVVNAHDDAPAWQ